MQHYISNMPLWAIALFIVSFLLSLGMLTRPVKQAALTLGFTTAKTRGIQTGILLFYVCWLAYASVLALNGAFMRPGLPPRVTMLTSVPLAVILFAFIGNTRLFKRLLQASTLESLISIHVFRVVGVFFFILYFYRMLDPEFALSAGAGDLITAAFAIPVARAVARKKSWSKTAVIAWNIFGMMDILTLMTFATLAALKPATAGQSIAEMGLFPFAWFPAFAPGTILFLHVAIFRKMAWK